MALQDYKGGFDSIKTSAVTHTLKGGEGGVSGAAGGEGRGGAGRRAWGQGTGAVGKGVERSFLFSLSYYILCSECSSSSKSWNMREMMNRIEK